MSLFNLNSDESQIHTGDLVRVNYADTEGIVVEIDKFQVMICYHNENDEEIVKEFPIESVEKI